MSLSFLRVEYLPAIILPSLIGIYFSSKRLLLESPSLAGWCLLAIGQNLLNDYFDKDREIPVGLKGLVFLFIVSTIFGFSLFSPEEVILPLLFFVLISLYNYRVKKIPVTSILIQVVAYILLPFLFYSEKIIPEVIIPLAIGGSCFQLIHEIVDKEATYSLLKRNSVTVAKLLAATTLLFLVYDVISLKMFFMLPVIVFFVMVLTGLFIDPYSKRIRFIGVYSIGFLTVFVFFYLIKLGFA